MTANKWGRGLIALLAVAVMVTFIGGMLVLVLNSGDDEEVAAPVATTQPSETLATTPPPATTVAPTDLADGQGGAAASEDSRYYLDGEGIPLPPMGIDTSNFEWTVTELDSSTGRGEAWISSLFEMNGELWAVGGAYEESLDGERSFVYRSSDGVSWEAADLPAGIGDGGHAQFTATEAGVVAVVNKWEEDAERNLMRVFVTTDGVIWTETDLGAFATSTEQMWINQVAGSGSTIVMVGSKEQVPAPGSYEPRVIVIEHDGYIVELDEETWSFEVSDAVSGEVVARGSQETLWMHNEDGQIGIYDGSELVFPMGWEELDRAGVAAHEEVQWGDRLQITLTKDDKTLTLDGFTGDVVVTDVSGAVLFEGSEQDLWQGPPPTFRDALGEVIVAIPWDVWNLAYEEAYSSIEGGIFAYSAEPVVLRSADGGATWQPVDLGAFAGDNFYFQSLAGGPNGFLAIGTQENVFFEGEGVRAPEAPPAPTVLTSSDGTIWTEVAADLTGGDWLHSLAAGSDGFLAVRGGVDGLSSVVASSDGSSWQDSLTQDDLDLELGQVWFNQIHNGGLGAFVTGGYDGWTEPDYEPVTIARDGRTVTYDMSVYTVTDDASGEVLFMFDESEYWMYEGEEGFGEPASGFKWGQGGFAMFNDDGTVIFAASHEQWENVMQTIWGQDPGVYYENEQVVLYRDGGTWTQVPLPDLDAHTWLGGAVVTDAAVIVSATAETHSETDFSVTNVIMVGVPAG